MSLLPSIPSVADLEQGAEKAEDKLLAILTQWSKESIAGLRAILEEYQISITFTKKERNANTPTT